MPVICPRTTELNKSKIFFSSFASATPFYGLLTRDLNHLFGFYVIEERPCHRLGGSVSRTANGVSNFGILVNHLWAVRYQLLAKDFEIENEDNKEVDDENEAGEETDNENEAGADVPSLFTIQVSEDKILNLKEYNAAKLNMEGLNIYLPNIEFLVCTSEFRRTGKGRRINVFLVPCSCVRSDA